MVFADDEVSGREVREVREVRESERGERRVGVESGEVRDGESERE